MSDERHHLNSGLMRESLVDKELLARTASPDVVRMLPQAHVVKVGGRSIIDRGGAALFPLVEAFERALGRHKLIIGTGGGLRSRHVFSIGIDLGLPTGVLAQLALADANGNAHILGTLLAPLGVIAIPPEISTLHSVTAHTISTACGNGPREATRRTGFYRVSRSGRLP